MWGNPKICHIIAMSQSSPSSSLVSHSPGRVKNLTGTWGGGLKKKVTSQETSAIWAGFSRFEQFEQRNIDSLLGEEWWFQQEKWIADQQLSGLLTNKNQELAKKNDIHFSDLLDPRKWTWTFRRFLKNWWINFNGGNKDTSSANPKIWVEENRSKTYGFCYRIASVS